LLLLFLENGGHEVRYQQNLGLVKIRHVRVVIFVRRSAEADVLRLVRVLSFTVLTMQGARPHYATNWHISCQVIKNPVIHTSAIRTTIFDNLDSYPGEYCTRS
jgi:hypothetical protein